MNQSLQIACQPELETERNQLGNPGVLKPISGNAGIRKAKAATRHGAKDRSSNLTALKIIARQGADEKSQFEDWKAESLENLTKEIAQIHRVHNNAMEAQREEIENQREQFQFEIEDLRERILDLEREKKKEGSVQGQTRRPGPVQNTPKKAPTTSNNGPTDEQVDEQADRQTEEPENGKTPGALSQNQARRTRGSTPNVGTKRHITEKPSYATVAASKPSQIPEHPWTQVKYKKPKQSAQ